LLHETQIIVAKKLIALSFRKIVFM
jgi:hypothetical protein